MDKPTTTVTEYKLSDGSSLEITTTTHKRSDIINMKGRVDTYTAPFLQESLDALIENGRYNIAFDMSEVDFLSSKGLWVLTETQKKCKKFDRGELVLCGVIERISDSLKLVGMDEYFRTFDDVLSAVGSF